MDLYTLSLLIAANIFWAANPTAAKILISEVGAPTAAWLKYFMAGLSFMICLPIIRTLFSDENKNIRWLPNLSPCDLTIILIIALTTCFLSPLFQMQGLNASSAINNSLLVALEPLLTLVLAYFILGNPITKRDTFSLIVGVIGFLVLSNFNFNF